MLSADAIGISDSRLAAQAAEYRDKGYVAIRGLLCADEIDAFRAEVDKAVAHRTRKDTRAFDEKSPYGQSFLQCISLWEDFPSVKPLTFHPRIAGAAANLLGCERVRLWHDQALYKQPGGRETEAHQDHAYWPVEETDMVTAWIPLVDVNEASGCMGYVPHTQDAAREFVDIFNSPGAGAAYGARFGAAEFIPANRGDVIFHAARTVHMARANTRDFVRAVHTVVYFRDGCTRSKTGADVPADRNGTLPGAPINGPATPIAWPLPPGYLPPPGPWPEPMGARQKMFVEMGVIPGA
jgi:ectoine hydroxylase-related dioxygenase (phytanoyl-CoA dioxygenase family)